MNDYYVYGHKKADTDELFYIGKGRKLRYKSKVSRSKDWHSVVNKHGFLPYIIKDGLSEEGAIDLERKLILENKEGIVNKQLPTQRTVLKFSELEEIFYYDETSPTCLRWKKNIIAKNGAEFKCKDKQAGYDNGRYFRVEYNGNATPVHRVILVLLLKRDLKDEDVDHIDGNCYNNSSDNLRGVSRSMNMKNKLTPCRTGIPFVTCNENYKGTRPHYTLTIRLNGKTRQFRFYFSDPLTKAYALNCCLIKKEEFKEELFAQGVTRRTFYGKD